jgi:hypothetical protein
MDMSQTKTIKALEAYVGVPDGVIVTRGTLVQTKMTGNSNFPNPPVVLAVFKTDIDQFSALMAEALDGSKKIVAEKNKQRGIVIKNLRALGRYVELNCKDDMAIFLSSGFEPALNTKAQTPSLTENIRKLEHGSTSGQIVVWLRAVPNAGSYELRYAPVDNNGASPVWTTQSTLRVKTPVTVSGLKPGTNYAFQVRSLSKSGFSDWSDSVTLISM